MTPPIQSDDARAPQPGTDIPSVSVILLVRNGETFIAEALASVFRSDLRPLEILVIDGGSSDATAQIAARFPLTRVVPQASIGIANAYNLGIDLAKGDLIAFISHDDIWEEHKLDVQVDFMRRRADVQFTVTMVKHFLQPGASLPPGFRPELLDRPVPGFIMEALVARKSLFDTMGRFDPGFAVGEDTDWFARAKDAGIVSAVLPQVLVRKRVHGANTSLNVKGVDRLLLRAMRNSVHRKRSTCGTPQ